MINPREKQVLGLIALGLTNSEIAQRMKIPEQSVKNDIASVHKKTGISSRTLLVSYTIYRGYDIASDIEEAIRKCEQHKGEV